MPNKQNSDILIFGMHAILEAVQAGKSLQKVFLQTHIQSSHKKELLHLLKLHQIPVSQVPLAKLNRISRKCHQGALAYISPIIYQSVENVIDNCYEKGKLPFVLLLDGVKDVGNIGAIARTAVAVGIDALILPMQNSPPINGDAIKASAGALLHLKVCRVSSLVQVAKYLKNRGLAMIACTEKAEKSVYCCKLQSPIFFVLGSEEKGIQPELLKLADCQAKLPMQAGIASLNVAVAASIFLYEKVRNEKDKLPEE